MSQKKDENELNQNSFENEDRISNVIITTKNKDILNSNKQLKNSEKDPKAKNSYNTINYNSISNKNLEEQNNTTTKPNGKNLSNAEMEFLNGMKSQLGYSESQNLDGMDQQKLFETFLMFQKFLSNQAANNNDNKNNNNLNTIAANQHENFNNENDNKKANGNPNVNMYINKGDDGDFNSVPPDYIHHRKKNKGSLSNSNIVNEFKRSSTNNFSTSDQAGSLEKNQANTIMKDEVKFNSNNEITKNKNNNLFNTLNNKNSYEESDSRKNLNGTNEEKSLNTKEINKNSNNNLNNSVNNKIGFNRLKNRNKSTSIEFDLEKERNENYENNNENRNTLEQKSNKTDLPSNPENEKIHVGENKAIECTPNKDIEFSNRCSFDVKKENLPSNCENFSAKKPEINQTNKIGFNNQLSNKISDDKNLNSLMNNESDTLIKKLDSNDSIKKFNDEVSANKNNKKDLNKKLNEEDFMPKKDALLNSVSNKNKSATENTSRVDNFDDIPIKSSHTNFLELFEKNLAAEEANIYGTISNDYTANTNSEIKKADVSRRNNPRFKKEINISAPGTETKKYKYYSDNFEEKPNDGVNANAKNEKFENENHNEKISLGNYMTENPNNPKNRVKNGNINKNKKGVNNKSVEKTGSKRLDPAAKTQEDKSFNINLNGNLSGSTYIPNSKGKHTISNKRKNTKNNPLSASVNCSENLSMKEKEKENNSTNKNAQQPQHKQNAEASLKNLKNNILNKKLNKGLEHDSTSSTKAEPSSDKLQTLKNYKEFADIPEIKSLIQNNSNSNSHNTKVAFHSGDKNLITFGTTNRDSFGQQNPLNKNSSTPQFTIGFNAPYLNQPNATEKNSDENKVTKLIKSLLPFNTNEDDSIEENFTNENESPVKMQKGKINDNKEDAKAKEANDDQFDFFNDINKKINDRINLPISKEINQHASKKTFDSNKTKNIKETNEAPNKQNSINASKKDPVLEPNSIIDQTKGQKEELYGEKLKELEQEIQQLKGEKDSVSNLKQEYQRLYAELNEEIDNFYLKKDTESKEFEKWKEEETRKLVKEKKASEPKSGRLNQNIIPSKKDKEEIECLKNIIAKMQEEFKIKDNNNKLTIEKLKRKLEESNSKVTELSKVIEDLNTQKNVLMRSNSTNLIKVNNANLPNLAAGGSNSSINLNSNNKRTINYNDPNSINNINNNSTYISPSTQGLLSRNIEEQLNSNKTNKSINFQLNSASSGSANLINNFNLNANTINSSNNNVYNAQEINKQRVNNAQRNSEDLNKLASKQMLMKKDSKEIFGKSINNNNTNINNNNNYHSNMNNKSVELVKKRSSESEINIKTKIQNNSPGTNIISDPNLLYNPSDDGVYDLVFLENYHPRNDLKANVLKHENFPDGKIVKFYDNDKREVIFPSGVRKEIFSDGYQIVYFNNKDIKQVFPNGKQIYFFSEAKTIQTTFPDNLQVFKFENGQIEKHYGEGYKQIIFPDGTHKVLFEDENIDDKNVD